MNELDTKSLASLLESGDEKSAIRILKNAGRLQLVDWRDEPKDVLVTASNLLADPEMVPIEMSNGDLQVTFKGETRFLAKADQSKALHNVLLGLKRALARRHLMRIWAPSLDSDTLSIAWLSYRDDRSLKKRCPDCYEDLLMEPLNLGVFE